MHLTPNDSATRRTKDRVRQHGPDFTLIADEPYVDIMGGPALCVKSPRTNWIGWFRTDELEWGE